jgi:hypothetical protein
LPRPYSGRPKHRICDHGRSKNADSGVGINLSEIGKKHQLFCFILAALNARAMLRNFFEGLGDIFQATFKILPFAGDTVNRLFMLIIAGGLIYWIIQMRKHKANGEA